MRMQKMPVTQLGRRTKSVSVSSLSAVFSPSTWNDLSLPLQQKPSLTGPQSVVVSASDCGSEGLGFESHQSHVGFFSPGRLPPRAGSAMGPVGRLEPHS